MPLQEFDSITLKSEYRGTLGDTDAVRANTNRTPGKDEVAQYIVEHVIEEGRWPIQMTTLADETDYSRQHCANVVKDYFIPENEEHSDEVQRAADTTDTSPMTATPSQPTATDTDGQAKSSSTVDTETIYYDAGDGVQSVRVHIPNDVDQDSYVRGYLDAKKQE